MAYRVVTEELTTPLETLEEAEAAKVWRENMYPTTTHVIVKDSKDEEEVNS